MKLSAPKQMVWTVAVVVGILGILGKITAITFVSVNAFWFVAIGFTLLAIGTMMKRA